MFRASRLLRAFAPDGSRKLPADVLRKRLVYHASKRGMRENEKVLGRFAQLRVADMDEQQLQQFEKLLDQFDPDMNKWLLRKEPIPKELASPVWDDILKFIDEGPAGFETGHN